MRLLVFAHFAESRAFLEKEDYAAVSLPFSGLWRGERDFVLVGGEGSEAACRAAYVLGKFPQIDALYNLGTAAGLSSRLPLKSVHSIRTCYRCRGERQIDFHSFTSSDPDARTDLISSDRRITSPQEADYLESFAPLADREAHSLARAAHRAAIPFHALKLVSDVPATASIDCQEVLKQAPRYSRTLLDCYQSTPGPTPDQDSEKAPDGFYFTTTMRRRYLLLKDSLPPARLGRIIHRIWKAPLSPKERGKALLKRLEKISLPAETERELQQIFSPLQGEDRRVSYGKSLESAKFNLQVNIDDPEDVEDLIEDLKRFDYQRFQKLFPHA